MYTLIHIGLSKF